MNGFRFHLEYPTQQAKRQHRPGGHTGNVIAVVVDRLQQPSLTPDGDYAAVIAVFNQRDSPVASGAVNWRFLRARCTRVGEIVARQVHPQMFVYLDRAIAEEAEARDHAEAEAEAEVEARARASSSRQHDLLVWAMSDIYSRLGLITNGPDEEDAYSGSPVNAVVLLLRDCWDSVEFPTHDTWADYVCGFDINRAADLTMADNMLLLVLKLVHASAGRPAGGTLVAIQARQRQYLGNLLSAGRLAIDSLQSTSRERLSNSQPHREFTSVPGGQFRRLQPPRDKDD